MRRSEEKLARSVSGEERVTTIILTYPFIRSGGATLHSHSLKTLSMEIIWCPHQLLQKGEAGCIKSNGTSSSAAPEAINLPPFLLSTHRPATLSSSTCDDDMEELRVAVPTFQMVHKWLLESVSRG